MKKHISKYKWLAACILILNSCLMENPESKMQKLADKYKNKEISNTQMLFAMGKVFRDNPENGTIRNDYFQKLIFSGYSSHIVHFYLDQADEPLSVKDMELLILAIHQGNHYNMAEKFTERFSGKYREQLIAAAGVYDSLHYYNNQVKNNPGVDAFVRRGKFFSRLNAADLANADIDQSMHFEPCNPTALFEKTVALFHEENTKEVAKLLEECNQKFESGQHQWFPVFNNLAKEAEGLNNSNLPNKEVLFKLANLYINAGFPEIALRKSKELLKTDEIRNPDYLALQGFIYYKMNNKEMARQYVSEAERISGKKSKLSTLIADMK